MTRRIYDLHRHLEGSHSPAALFEVASRHRIDGLRMGGRPMTLAEIQVRASMSAAGGWQSFYDCILFARQAYVSFDVIRELTYLACLEAAAEAAGAEYRFSLFSMTQAYLANTHVDIHGVDDVTFADVHARGILLAIVEGRARAVHESGRTILLRAGLSRSFEIPSKYAAIEPVLVEHADAFVGLDVLGKGSDAEPEILGPELLRCLERLRPQFGDLSLHAGELDGAASVTNAIALQPDAIGHGLRSLEDASLCEELARRGVTLELCPTSNALVLQTRVAELTRAHGAHPLPALQRLGVRCALSSDDPSIFGTTLPKEWDAAAALGADLDLLEAHTGERWARLHKAH